MAVSYGFSSVRLHVNLITLTKLVVPASVRTKTISNLASARISVPPLVRDAGEDFAQAGEPHRYKWRTDLGATEPYWRGWFTGLSNKFLACKTAKLLLLAGADRLDKELMVAQMQGEFTRVASLSQG